MKTYEETIQRLGRQAFDKHMQGSWKTMPDGVGTVAWIYGKDTGQVEQDIAERRDALIDAQVAAHRKSVINEAQAEPVAWLVKWANAYDGEAYTEWQKGYDAARSVVKAHLPVSHTQSHEPEQAEPVEPMDVGQLEYRGNSVAFIYQKMTAYRSGIDAAWDVLRVNGLHPDGKTSLASAVEAALGVKE